MILLNEWFSTSKDPSSFIFRVKQFKNTAWPCRWTQGSNTTSWPATLQRLSWSYFISVKNLFHKDRFCVQLNLFNVISNFHIIITTTTTTTIMFVVVTQTQGSWVLSLSTCDWHRRVGYVVEELKLTTLSYIALMMKFNILVAVDKYYNNINSKKASAGENRCFSKWPLNRDVGWVVVIERVPQASRCQYWHTTRSAPRHRISYSLSPALAFYKNTQRLRYCHSKQMYLNAHSCLLGDAPHVQWAAKSPWMLHLLLYGDWPTGGFIGQSTWLTAYFLPSGVGLL